MGFNFRKSFKIGPARVNLSKSGVGYSVGAGGLRYTKKAGGKKKADSGCLVSCLKGMFWLFIATVAIYLVSTYWKWLLALVAVAAVAFVAYQFYIQRKISSARSIKAEQQEDALTALDSDKE